MKKLLLLAIASFSFWLISTDTRAISCHGYSAVKMLSQATNIAGVGVTIVYIFNQNTKNVNKYEVNTSAEDGLPFSIIKEAYPVAVEHDIKSNYGISINGVINSESRTLMLPPDFQIHSSAGALLSLPATYHYVGGLLDDLPGDWLLSLKQLLI